jgi:hypothetical protein
LSVFFGLSPAFACFDFLSCLCNDWGMEMGFYGFSRRVMLYASFAFCCMLLGACTTTQTSVAQTAPTAPLMSTPPIATNTTTAQPTSSPLPTTTPSIASAYWQQYHNQVHDYTLQVPIAWGPWSELNNANGMELHRQELGLSMRVEFFAEDAAQPELLVKHPAAHADKLVLSDGSHQGLAVARFDQRVAYQLQAHGSSGQVLVSIEVPSEYFAANQHQLLATIMSLDLRKNKPTHDYASSAKPTAIPQAWLDQPNAPMPKQWREFSGAFGASLRIPADWPIGASPDFASQSQSLHVANPDLRVFVTSGRYLFDPELELVDPSTSAVPIQLDCGQAANLYIADSDGMIWYQVIRENRETVNLYKLTIAMSQEWYQEHTQLVETITKSFCGGS